MRAIIVSIGTGKGVEHGIAKAINGCNPTLVVYLVTEKSKNTVDLVKPLLNSDYSSEQSFIADENDFEKCYADAKKVLEKLVKKGYSPENITVDFTSGTKAMSSGLVLASVSLECDNISYVYGKRDDIGRVISGTERNMILKPTEVIADGRKKLATLLFNKYQYEGCLSIIENVKKMTGDEKILGKFNTLETLAKAYSAFDRFDHENAMGYLKKLDEKTEEEMHINTYKNKVLLHKEINSKKYSLEQIADLIENAKRRGKEGKFDDAIARMYRVIELLAQFRLWSKHNIDSSDVDIHRIPKEHRGHYEKMRKNGTISIGLSKAYSLLKDLDDNLGKDFSSNPEILKVLNWRNYSILAHGTKPINGKQYEEALKVVENFAAKYFQELKQMIEQAYFPKVKI
ncbi:MAG: TIGR02710 family CRISPR-associated CARF protein [Thermoplasmatales archaeon]|nr:TIGR02710 family CRISPR-associated CARF protein [Thermoplasmatales archaeon]